MSRETPWAVLLCKFKDDQRGFVEVNMQDVQAMFTAPDIDSVVTFWRDVSYGELDLSGSKVLLDPYLGWLTLDQKQQDFQDALLALGKDKARAAMFSWALKAANDASIKLDPYYGVTVYMSTQTDLWGVLQGSTGQVVCDTASNLSQICQEYGHGYGLNHSRSVTEPSDYNNPFCIMSGLRFGYTEPPPTFSSRFGGAGPLLCSPYVDAAGWLTPSRSVRIETNGTFPALITLQLSALGQMTPTHPQVAVFGLNVPYEATYFIEYRYGGWDRGLSQGQVVIHQRRPDGYAYYAGSIPATVGFVNEVTLLPGRSWIDAQFDLSVRLARVLDQDNVVEITVGPAAAVRPLNVRSIARSKLNLTGRLSVGSQILQPAIKSLRTSLLALLNR